MIATDRPSAYIPADRRHALADGRELPEHVRGAALFADISGFTALTEALAQELGSHRASEVLTGHLDRVFHAVIDELHGQGGVVIYFSGDALTCWLDDDDGSRAVASALGMQEAIRREGMVTTPGGLSMQLQLKVAIAVGPARRFVVGDPGIQLIDVLAGGLIDRIAAVEQLAEKGEVLVHESALESLADRFELGESRISPDAGRVTVIRGAAHAAPHPSPPPTHAPTLADTELPVELARQWLLAPVYDRLTAGRGEFLAELRPAYPVFLSFTGIDYDAEESAGEKLDEFVRAAQHTLTSYGGSLLQVTLGDKGAYLYGVFGTPFAHEDDAARACAAALELQSLEHSTAARGIRIGITYGRLHSGTHGHARRRTFCCLGDAVNLAARLMSKAPLGGVYISDSVQRRLGDGFTAQELEPLTLKGKAAPVRAHALTGASRRRSRRVERYQLPLVGREQEIGVLDTRLQQAVRGRGRIVGLSAEAGMGKSRLVAEFIRSTRGQGLHVAVGECQSYGTNAGYVVWGEIWRDLFGLDESLAPAEQIAALERALGEIDEGLVPRAPLLDTLLGLPIPDTELTEAFDPQLRKTSLENLLADCLRALAKREPLVLILEDCHWLDPLSRELLTVIARTIATAAVLLVVVYRPEAALPQDGALGSLRGLEEIELSLLDGAQMSAVVQSKLSQLLGESGQASESLRDLVVNRAQGNPFYAEELLNYVHEQGVDLSDRRALIAIELPESLHSLVLSRIDTLPEAPRHTLKVASVVGRSFRAPMLPGVYPDLGGLDEVRVNLQALRRVDLVIPDRELDESFLMKHAVTQEVAYESLPYALRATLHGQVGAYLEAQTDAPELPLDLLAHHYWHSADEAKKRHYLRLAAQQAEASYANAAAIEYYERLASLLTDAERVDALLELGKVLELVGEWDRARGAETGALELAQAIGDEGRRAWCEAAIAEVARKQNRYDEAAERLSRAAAGFEALGDEPGLGRVLHLEGTLAAQRGKLDDARARYERSLELRRRLGDVKMMASVLSNLGIVAEYEADFPLSRSLHAEALELRTELGDRWAIANSMTNLGMIATLEGRNQEARTYFEDAMRLNSEVGDNWRVVVCHNNLGNACRGLGDYAAARDEYEESLRAHLEHDDKWALAFLLEDVARLAAMTGEGERALELLGAADTIREQIGSPRSASLDQAILADVESAITGLSAAQQSGARARGGKFDPVRAIELARFTPASQV